MIETDSELILTVLPMLTKAFDKLGTGLGVTKAYQSEEQGKEHGLYFHLLPGSKPTSTQGSLQKYDRENHIFDEKNRVHTSSQLQLFVDIPARYEINGKRWTANDLLLGLYRRMINPDFLAECNKHGFGILIRDGVTNSTQKNEREQWEEFPLLELTITYVSGYNDQIAAIDTFDGNFVADIALDCSEMFGFDIDYDNFDNGIFGD